MSSLAVKVKKEAMFRSGKLTALGAMSGTSLDGIDAAVLCSDGHTIEAFGPTAYRPFSLVEIHRLRAALGCWPESVGVAPVAELIEATHEEILQQFQGIDIVGFHGQTLAHAPRGRGTHQAGDGDRLAARLGLPVVWDFRSADVQAGGEGAPLAPFFHFACARWLGAETPLCFINLGGVGNLTWIDPRKSAPETPGALLAFDTGPANAPLNDLLLLRRGISCDQDGALAASGRVSGTLVERFLTADYFACAPPKSLDRNDFSDLLVQLNSLSDSDAAATLTAMIAASVAAALEHCPQRPRKVLVTGGGRLNPVLMARLNRVLSCPVVPVESVGLNGDMLEAQAFAYLAVRVARDLPTSCRGTTGVSEPVSGGKVSFV